MDTYICNLDNAQYDRIKQIYSNGGVVAYPTDTVYGLGCDPYNQTACDKIMAVKHRPNNKSMILLLGFDVDIMDLAKVDSYQKELINKLKGKSVTFIVRPLDNSKLSPLVTNNGQSIAIRHTDDIRVKPLLDKVKLITSTSCNISNKPTCNNLSQIKDCFDGKIECIIDGGENVNSKPSTIIDIRDGVKVLREGAVSEQELLKIIDKKV